MWKQWKICEARRYAADFPPGPGPPPRPPRRCWPLAARPGPPHAARGRGCWGRVSEGFQAQGAKGLLKTLGNVWWVCTVWVFTSAAKGGAVCRAVRWSCVSLPLHHWRSLCEHTNHARHASPAKFITVTQRIVVPNAPAINSQEGGRNLLGTPCRRQNPTAAALQGTVLLSGTQIRGPLPTGRGEGDKSCSPPPMS